MKSAVAVGMLCVGAAGLLIVYDPSLLQGTKFLVDAIKDAAKAGNFINKINEDSQRAAQSIHNAAVKGTVSALPPAEQAILGQSSTPQQNATDCTNIEGACSQYFKKGTSGFNNCVKQGNQMCASGSAGPYAAYYQPHPNGFGFVKYAA